MGKRAFEWDLDRPLAIFDIESTGTSPRADRIIELAVVKLQTNTAKPEVRTWRVHPGVPIPPETTAIHGIADRDVAGCPPFKDCAADVALFLEGCDLAGYNILRFDLPLLVEEYARAGVPFEVEGRRIIDAQRVFHRREPRDLAAALAFFCGEMHLGAHGAEPDALATLRVLEGQFLRYPDLPRDLDQLDEYCNPREPDWVDRTGRLKWVNGEVVLNFGRKKGETLRRSIEGDPGFVKWLLKSDFPKDTREIVEQATRGSYPTRPPPVRAENV